MLGYYLNNQAFWLEVGASVRLSFINPACNFEEIPGDAALGLTIPINEQNRMLLGNPERFERKMQDKDKEYENFEIRFAGVLFIRGTLVITDSDGTNYKGWVRSEVGNLGKKHREKYIYEIDAFAIGQPWKNLKEYSPDEDDYACPRIYNPMFFKDKGTKVSSIEKVENPNYYPGSGEDEYIEEEQMIEAHTLMFRNTTGQMVNFRKSDGTILTETTVVPVDVYEPVFKLNVVSPMLFLHRTLDYLFRDALFFIDKNYLTENEDIKRLIIYNNYDITVQNFNVDTLEVRVSNWWDGVNIYNSVTKLESITRSYSNFVYYENLLPRTYLKDFLISTQNLLNVIFFFRRDRKVDIIDRESILTGETIDIADFHVDAWEMGEKKDVRLKFKFEHDDDDDFFQERWEDIEDLRNDEKEAVETWDDVEAITEPEVGEIRYVKDVNQYFRYAWTQEVSIDPNTGEEMTYDSLGWTFLAFGFQHGYYNREAEEEEEITTNFSTLMTGRAPTDSSVPVVHQVGNMRSMKYAYSSFSPRLLFYKGGDQGEFETKTLALDWEKENKGLIAKRYPKWAEFWSHRQPVTGKFNLTVNSLDYVLRNFYKKFRTKEGEFIIEELEVDLGVNAIGVTTIKGYKV